MQSIPSTEQTNIASKDIDAKSIPEIIALMHQADQTAVAAVYAAQQPIAKIIDVIIQAFQQGGRLFYVGAGTSGRLGVLDAAECPPTFSVDPSTIQGIIAGGKQALTTAVEGAEDDAVAGKSAILAATIAARDVVLGISASGLAPFVIAALQTAKTIGSQTWLLTCNNQYQTHPALTNLDGVIFVDTGPEIITGSTRLKAGTATKLVLNMLTTISMLKSGKVYGNLMVDVKPTNNKLRQRAGRIIATLAKCTTEEAQRLLVLSGNQPKVAIVMQRQHLDRIAAEKLLAKHHGCLREIIGDETT